MSTRHLKALSVYTGAQGRRYVDAADVGEICGIAGTDLDRKFRPANWAFPRDLRWDGKRMWFAVLSLPQLADQLAAHGASDAALKLREWCTAWVEAAVAEQSVSPGSGGTEGKQDLGADRITAAPAVSPAPTAEVSRLTQWEKEHDA